MKNKINKSKIKKMLNSGFTNLSTDEIKQLIDEELSKDESLIDTDYIDLCFNLLELKKDNKPVLKNHIKLSKVIIIAATFIIIFSITIPAIAKFANSNADENIVKYVDESFIQNLANGKTDAITHSDESNATVKSIKAGGIKDVIIPSAILNDFNICDIQFDNLDGMTTSNIKFNSKTSKINGYIYITQYDNSDYEFTKGQTIIGSEYDTVKQITVNGMDVLIFSYNDNCSISYIDNHIEYYIILEKCSVNDAVKIMKSL